MIRILESTKSYEYAIMSISGENGETYYLAKPQRHEIWVREEISFPNCLGSGYTTFKSQSAALNKLNRTIESIGFDNGDEYYLLILNKVTKHSEKYGDFESFDLVEKKPIKFEVVGSGFDRHLNATV